MFKTYQTRGVKPIQSLLLFTIISLHKIPLTHTNIYFTMNAASMCLSVVGFVYTLSLLARNIPKTPSSRSTNASNSALFARIKKTFLLSNLTTVTLIILSSVNFFLPATHLVNITLQALTWVGLHTSLNNTAIKKMLSSFSTKTTSNSKRQLELQILCNSIDRFLPSIVKKNQYFDELVQFQPDLQNKSKLKILQNPTFVKNKSSKTFFLTEKESIHQLPKQYEVVRNNLPKDKVNKYNEILEFKHSVSAKRYFLYNLQQQLKNIIQDKDIHTLYQNTITSHPQSLQTYNTDTQNALHIGLKKLIQKCSNFPANSQLQSTKYPDNLKCDFSGVAPIFPIEITIKNIAKKTLTQLVADLHTFEEILENFLEKIQKKPSEKAKILAAAKQAVDHGDTASGIKLSKLAKSHEQYSQYSNAIYKAIQIWPDKSAILIKFMLNNGVECGSKGPQSDTALDLATRNQLTQTIDILKSHNNSMTNKSPIMRTDFKVQSKSAHQWPKLNLSILDPSIEITCVKLYKELLVKKTSDLLQNNAPRSKVGNTQTIVNTPMTPTTLQKSLSANSMYNLSPRQASLVRLESNTNNFTNIRKR